MPAAPLPHDEADRLAALLDTGLLDRAPDPRFQMLTRLAATLLRRPIAIFTILAADKQVFGGAVGVSFRETPRSASFCCHAILQPGQPFVIEDARADARFADSPLVLEHGFRFYAGVVVRAACGQPVGVLCVLDRTPGQLTEGELETLQSLRAEIEAIVLETGTGETDDLLPDLRRAVEAGDLFVEWQPVATAGTGWICGHEALVRWNAPGRGAVPPDRFIPLAEKAALVGRIDSFVLRTACTQAVSWAEPLSVSVNVSASWFGHETPLLPRMVGHVLSNTGLEPERLVIEITERTLIETPSRALREVQALKALGVRLALDDFGTGYSSLSYVEAFPFDCVKLDRSFVRGMGINPRADAVARAVLGLGHDLGMTVCAEGVERPHQLEALQQQGCDLVQGWLIGRPVRSPFIAGRFDCRPKAASLSVFAI